MLLLSIFFQEVEKSLPKPDIGHLMDNLEYFRKNIFKSLPNSRWGSSRDAFCFRRVKTHVENFKVCIYRTVISMYILSNLVSIELFYYKPKI